MTKAPLFHRFRRFIPKVTALALLAVSADYAEAQSIIPGTGRQVQNVGDDFEDENWTFNLNWPKSSRNLDNNERYPTAGSANGRWLEGLKRGTPDLLKRVPTPAGGLQGSKGAMRMQSLYTGIPYAPSYKFQQDDLIAACGQYSPSYSPNVICRVYLPPFEEWENRTGSTFGFRLDLQTTQWEKGRKRRSIFSSIRSSRKVEAYWPGYFIQFHSKTDANVEKDYATLLVRCNEQGQDFVGRKIEEPGWWTLGMSVTPDGRVHYFASPGVDPLTQADYISSHHAYGFRAEAFNGFFFNIVNADNGKTWSTEWIVDDAAMFIR